MIEQFLFFSNIRSDIDRTLNLIRVSIWFWFVSISKVTTAMLDVFLSKSSRVFNHKPKKASELENLIAESTVEDHQRQCCSISIPLLEEIHLDEGEKRE